MRQLLLLLLPTLTLANIQIDLTEIVHSNVVSSNSRGFIERVIVEQDRDFLGIQDEHLKQAIEKINGKKPDEVYLTSSKPSGDLYKRFGWKQVHLKIQPLNNDSFYDFKTDSVKQYRRDNLIYAFPNITIVFFMTNRIYSYWTTPTNITGDAVTIMFDTDDNSAYFFKTFGFGARTKYMQMRDCVTDATLQHAQEVREETEVLRKIMKVEIPYDVSLSGDVIAKYNVMHNNRYIFKFDISDIQKANNITMSHRFYQNLIYQVESDAHIYIRDSNDKILKSIPVECVVVNIKGIKKVKAEGVPVTRKKMALDIPDDLAIRKVGYPELDNDCCAENMEKPETETKEEKNEN